MAWLSLIKAVGAPGSSGFLVVSVAAGFIAMYVWPRSRRFGRRWLAAVAGGYVALGLPWVAGAIAHQLPAISSADLSSLRGIDTIVLLDGDNNRARVLETARVYAGVSPRIVWVLGEPATADDLVAAGVPEERVANRCCVLTTREQVAQLKELAASRTAGQVAVVASRLQAARVAALTGAAGLQVRSIPAAVDAEPPTAGLRLFLPSYAALSVSRDGLYELAALAYYRWRGWI